MLSPVVFNTYIEACLTIILAIIVLVLLVSPNTMSNEKISPFFVEEESNITK